MQKVLQYKLPKFKYLNRYFKQNPFKLLDIGSGNHSASKTKKLFPNCEYHGVDREKDFNNDSADYDSMSEFYEMDLTLLNFDNIPNDYFDFIRIAHVVEHLFNGDKVVRHLLSKLKKGGYIYIEYPGVKSTKLPSMKETLNFYDDPTHVRIYSVQEFHQLFKNENMKVISSGTRRNIPFILAMPFRIIGRKIQGKELIGNIFWDILGFAEYVLAKKQ